MLEYLKFYLKNIIGTDFTFIYACVQEFFIYFLYAQEFTSQKIILESVIYKRKDLCMNYVSRKFFFIQTFFFLNNYQSTVYVLKES